MFKFTKLFTLLLLLDVSCAFALDTPTEDFIDNNDGTVTHKKTGLSWQRCSVGQIWTGSSCSGTSSVMNWDSAMASYGNKTDCNQWRLPRIDELISIVEYGIHKPAINSTIFPNTPNDFLFRSTSVYPSLDDTWIVNFSYGQAGHDAKGNNGVIRLVRGGQSCSFDTFTPSNDFTDNGNGTVTHKKTGLMWQRCAVGQTWINSICSGSALTMPYNSAITQASTLAGYGDWRVPTLNELITILEYKNHSPTINNSLFPNTDFGFWYWSTTNSSFYRNFDYVWVLSFNDGGYTVDSKISSNAVRLVRTALVSNPVPAPIATQTTIDLSATLSQSSSRIQQNTNIIYTATVTNNGTGTANNSLLKIYLPPRNVSIVSMTSDCVTTGKSITCSLGSLAAGASVTHLLKVSYTKSGGSSVSALALTDSGDTNSANNVSRIVTSITK